MSGDETGPRSGTEKRAADGIASTADTTPPDGRQGGPIRHMHDVFSDPWRRAILYYLQERGQPSTVTALARRLVAWFQEARRRRPRSDGGTPSLRSHVVEMAAFGILGHDPEADTVWIPETVAVSVAPPWPVRHSP